MATRKTVYEWINERRLDLGLTWSDLAEVAGVRRTTIHRWQWRKGIPLTERKVEKALRWSAGSLDRIRDGSEPIEESGEPQSAPPVTNDLAPPKLQNEDEQRLWLALSLLDHLTNEDRLAMLVAYRRKRSSEQGKGHTEGTQSKDAM